MKTNRKCFLFLLICFALILPRQTARSQASIQVGQNLARLLLPEGVGFEITAHSDSPVTRAVLLYGTNGRTCLTATARQEPSFKPTKWANVSWFWDFNRTGSLPPGVEIWWQWELHNERGDTVTTEKKTILVEDTGQKWKNVKSSGVDVYWFEGDTAFGQMVLDQAARSLARLEKEAGLASSGEVRLNIYASAEQVRKAALKLPEWAAGVAYPEYGSILLGIPPGQDEWSKRSIAHELAHLVTGERIFNCYGNTLPTWLEEGLAVYAEGELEAYRMDSVTNALKTGKLPELRSLAAGFAADSQLAQLEYSQGGVMVSYLLDTYGAEKMAGLLAAMQSGMLVDKALAQVYGLDTAGLDNAWRASLGFTPAVESSPTAASGVQNATPIATLALWTPAFGAKKSATPAVTLAPPAATPAPLALAATDLPAPTALPSESAVQEAPGGAFLWAAVLLAVLAVLLGGYWLYQRNRFKS